MPRYDIVLDDGQIIVYATKKSRSHHGNGWKSISAERIPLENLPRKTLVKLTQKGLAKIPKEVLP